MKTFWLSFANEKFLGAVLADANSFIEAHQETFRRKCNPGGEVWSIELPEIIEDPIAKKFIDEMPRYKLFTKEQIPNPIRLGDIIPGENE